MYLLSQLSSKNPHKALKIQEKCIFQQSADLCFKNSIMGPPHGTTELSKQAFALTPTKNLVQSVIFDT